MTRRAPRGFTLVEVLIGSVLGALVMTIVILLYSQTQKMWTLGQTQISVDTDARRVLTQIERKAVMAKSIATFAAYPYGYVKLPSPDTDYYASSYGYVVPTSVPTSSAGTYDYLASAAPRPADYLGLPYPTATPSASPTPAAQAVSSDVLYMAVPHTAPSPSCSSNNDLYLVYADPYDSTLLKQTVYMCYTKSVNPPPVTDATLATNLGAQQLNSADYTGSPRTSVLTDKLDPSHGFSIDFPTSTTVDVTVKVKFDPPGTNTGVFGQTVSNTYTTRIYTRNR